MVSRTRPPGGNSIRCSANDRYRPEADIHGGAAQWRLGLTFEDRVVAEA